MRCYMSGAMGSNTKRATVYVELLDEGTFVIRPTLAIPRGKDIYEIEAPDDYDDDLETWKFPPGTVVHCIKSKQFGDDVLLAFAEYRPNQSYPTGGSDLTTDSPD